MKKVKLIAATLLVSVGFVFISCEKDAPQQVDQQVEVNSLKAAVQSPFELCFNPRSVDPYRVCGDNFTPVCACEAITFTSPCEAEKAGFRDYEYGNCIEAACVNEDVRRFFYTADMYCMIKFPVCGCNDVIYSSYCRAIMAGVTSWTPGPCGRLGSPFIEIINI